MNYSTIMDGLIEKEVETGQVKGASVLVYHKGEEVYFHAAGMADEEKGRPMQRDTIIRLFSMSKPITATAVMIAQEMGLLDLSDPVAKYLPEFQEMQVMDNEGNLVPADKQITLMHLMTMTSGIPYGENWEGCSMAGRKMQELFDELESNLANGEKLSTREMAREIAKRPLVCQPGERWVYGLSADILGAIVEVASGMRYSEFLKRYLFHPLGMGDTGFFVPEEKRDRFAMSYQWDWNVSFGPLYACDDNHLCVYYHEDVEFESGGAGMVSTLEDYGKFAQMLAAGGIYKGLRILGSASVQFMRTNHLTEQQMASLDWDSNAGYGYGCLMRVLVNQRKAGSQAPLGEFGWDGWTGNYVCMDPVNDLVIIYFIQRRGAGTTPVVRRLRAATYGALDNL